MAPLEIGGQVGAKRAQLLAQLGEANERAAKAESNGGLKFFFRSLRSRKNFLALASLASLTR